MRRRESDGHQSAGPKASLRTVPIPYLAHLRGGHRESREEAASGNNHMVDSEPVGPRSWSRYVPTTGTCAELETLEQNPQVMNPTARGQQCRASDIGEWVLVG